MITVDGILISEERQEALGMAATLLALLEDNSPGLVESMNMAAVELLRAWEKRLRTGGQMELSPDLMRTLELLVVARQQEGLSIN